MWNLQDDNELDKLSREAADNYPLDHSPDSWGKLHSRLDAEMPTEKRRRYLLFFLLFLFLGSGAFWLTRMNADDSNEPNIASNTVTVKQDKSVTPNADHKATTSNVDQLKYEGTQKPSTSKTVQESDGTNQIGTQPKDVTVNEQKMNRASQAAVHNNVSKSEKKRNQTYTGSRKKQNQKLNKEALIQDETIAVKEKDGKNIDMPPSADEQIKGDNPSTSSKSGDDKQNNLEESKKESKEEAEQKVNQSSPKSKDPKIKENSRWTFGAVYAPDISSVNFTHTQPAGFNMGLTLEYRLSKKFSLQSGLIYTKKNYKLYGDDYHPPKGSWFDYVHLEDVTGDCIMFDVPLNARFNAVRKKSSNIFVSAGLSTYLMREESYSYFYYYNSTPTTREKDYDANSEYFFSILNLSVGYEKKLTKAFSLQVEPFFKQPLTGLGFGDISLNSAGVYFSLRYNPLKTTKAPVAPTK